MPVGTVQFLINSFSENPFISCLINFWDTLWAYRAQGAGFWAELGGEGRIVPLLHLSCLLPRRLELQPLLLPAPYTGLFTVPPSPGSLMQKCIWNLHDADPPGFGARAAWLQVCFGSLHSTGLLLHSCSGSSRLVTAMILLKQLSWVNWSVTLLNENHLVNSPVCTEHTISTALNLCCYFCVSKHENMPHAFRLLLF